MQLRILVLEDDAGVRAFLEQTLAAAGHIVQTASRPSEASAFVLYDEPMTPDLAVLDIVLPERTGVEYARDLRQAFPRVGLLFITGWYTNYERVQDEARAMGPVLYKPFDRQALLDAIRPDRTAIRPS